MLKLAVIGQPISHSKSPLIHRQFAQQTGVAIEYEAIEVGPESISGFVSSFFNDGGDGLNVTVPLKQLAFDLAVERSERAQRAGAVNTLLRSENGQLLGDNTDGVGLRIDLEQNQGCSLREKSILVVGAGGAVRGALAALIETGAEEICVVNRTLSKAVNLLRDLKSSTAITEGAMLPLLSAQDFNSFRARAFDVVINGTSMGLHGEVPPIPEQVIGTNTLAYDMVYADDETPFNAWAKSAGAATVVDGIGMLVEQAAESFRLWTGTSPSSQEVIASLRSS